MAAALERVFQSRLHEETTEHQVYLITICYSNDMNYATISTYQAFRSALGQPMLLLRARGAHQVRWGRNRHEAIAGRCSLRLKVEALKFEFTAVWPRVWCEQACEAPGLMRHLM